jgi:hypothetical protein
MIKNPLLKEYEILKHEAEGILNSIPDSWGNPASLEQKKKNEKKMDRFDEILKTMREMLPKIRNDVP